MPPIARSFRSFIYRSRSWTKGLAPYVARTVTLRRVIDNRRIRESTRCSGLDEYFPLDINGHQQWLRIRGERQDAPVLLYLHGGPGGSQIPSYRHYQLDWERDFTIVHWEQRGTGKSYSRRLDLSTMTVAQLVDDALEVLRYLTDRFNRQDIVLLGHSWGSFLGLHVLQAQPKNVSAYVGVGQVSNQVESERRMYRFALDKALAENNQAAVDQLSRLEGYPEARSGPAAVASVRQWARHFGFLGSGPSDTGRTYLRLMDTPEYGLIDIYRFLKGTLVSSDTLGKVMLTDTAAQPTALARQFDVPIFLISGRRDHFTPTDLADAFLDSVSAPVKQHIIFEDSGHYPNEDEPERFISTLKELVGPYLDLSASRFP